MSSKGDKFLPLPTGELQGENVGELPDRGTSRGFTGKNTHADGADTSADATNRMGGFRGDSDHVDCAMPKKPMKGRA